MEGRKKSRGYKNVKLEWVNGSKKEVKRLQK
jgi:hypothetical protein